MDRSSASERDIRKALRWGSATLLVGGAIALLVLMAGRTDEPGHDPTRAAVAMLTEAGATGVPGAPPSRPPSSDGKAMPLGGVTADWSDVAPSVERSPIPEGAAADLDRLFATIIPPHDYFTTARELGNIDTGERTVVSADYEVGQREILQTSDGPREAELVYLDDLAAYWAETGLSLDQAALVAAAGRLRNEYYPLLSQHFGQEWRPGVDGDLRFNVLHLRGAADDTQLGYFTDENQYPRSLFSQSNEREMIYLNMSRLTLGSPLYDGTLVHEMQHLIQWNLDANEDRWLNEGLSQVAEAMAELGTVDPSPYQEQTNIRLDRWTDYGPESHAHYGGGFLYLLYLRQQAGDAALTELARHPANGLAAVRAVLAKYMPDLSLEAFTADWATALFLDGDSADRRFAIDEYDLPRPFLADRVRRLPYAETAVLDQYAIDYIDLDFRGRATIAFAGDTTTPLTSEPPNRKAMWFAPPSDSSRSRLMAAVDLPSQPTDLTFAAWYDLEPNYDFAYLSVSIDGGVTWRILEPINGSMGAYGPGWNGSSAEAASNQSGWVNERINLSPFAGKSVLLRFDVVTDFEATGRGFAISGLHITRLAEQLSWQPDGFVETGHILPQRWEVRLIREGIAPEVIPLTLDGLNQGRMDVDLGAEGGALVVMPLTPFVESAAHYWLSVER